MNKQLESRLVNFKFFDAMRHLEGEDERTQEVVIALSALLGNSGWIDGQIGVLADAACRSIGVDTDGEDSPDE